MTAVAGRRLVGLNVLLCLIAAAVPAAASAAPAWHELAQPPGSESIAAGDGRAYVAHVSNDLVHVDQLTDLGWQQVGGVVAHDPRAKSSDPSLKVAGDGHPWITWVEQDASRVGRVRVARYGHGSWHEIPGGMAPVNKGPDAIGPRLAFASGRAYVAYDELRSSGERVRVARLRAGSSAWDVVPGEYGSAFSGYRLEAAGGRLFYGAGYELGGASLYRLKADDSGFAAQSFPVDHAHFYDLANFDGSLGLLYNDDEDPFAPGPQRVAQLGSADNWSNVGGAIPIYSARSLAYVDGTPYVAGLDPSGRTVARLERGAWESLPGLGSQVDAVVGVRGAAWAVWRGDGARPHLSAFTDGAPDLPDGRDPVKPDRRDCGLLQRGGRGSDALVGGAGRDELLGFGGGDWLLGRGGRDCLFGGAGADRVYGGSRADFLYGGSENDRLHGGKGHDVLYGGSGADRIYPERGRDDVAARAGNDKIYARGGSVDHVDCGRGFDVLYASRGDGWRHCERVVLPSRRTPAKRASAR
jgi:hypothetical protein